MPNFPATSEKQESEEVSLIDATLYYDEVFLIRDTSAPWLSCTSTLEEISTREFPKNHREEGIVAGPRRSIPCRSVWCCREGPVPRRE